MSACIAACQLDIDWLSILGGNWMNLLLRRLSDRTTYSRGFFKAWRSAASLSRGELQLTTNQQTFLPIYAEACLSLSAQDMAGEPHAGLWNGWFKTKGTLILQDDEEIAAHLVTISHLRKPSHLWSQATQLNGTYKNTNAEITIRITLALSAKYTVHENLRGGEERLQ